MTVYPRLSTHTFVESTLTFDNIRHVTANPSHRIIQIRRANLLQLFRQRHQSFFGFADKRSHFFVIRLFRRFLRKVSRIKRTVIQRHNHESYGKEAPYFSTGMISALPLPNLLQHPPHSRKSKSKDRDFPCHSDSKLPATRPGRSPPPNTS